MRFLALKQKLIISVFTVLFIAVFAVSSLACTDIVVGKTASTDGSVITGHTVDWRYDSNIEIVPAMDHEPGTMAPVYENIPYNEQADVKLKKLGEIPQVEHTYKYFHGAYPYANEHQLIIGETTLGGDRETINSEEAIMTIEQLEVFALQRTDNARDAIKLMGELAEEYGFRASAYLGECLTVTDPDEAWVFEIFGVGPLWSPDSDKPGAVWAAQRVPDDHITVVPNSSRIGEIDPDDTDNFIVSDNYKETAIEMGMYDPDSGEPFIWKYAYGDAENFNDWGQYPRLYTVYNALGTEEYKLEDAPHYPFSIKPKEKVSVHDVIELYRNTMEGTPYDMTEDEGFYYERENGEMVQSTIATPQVTQEMQKLLDIEYYRPIARYYCSVFWVSQARDWLPDEIGGLLWFGLDNPENSPFIPMYIGTYDVPESWKVLQRDKYDENSAWWAFASVDDYVNQRYQILKPRLDEVLEPMQQHMFTMQDIIEEQAVNLYEDVGRDAAVNFLNQYTSSKMHWAESVYWDLADKFRLKMNNNLLFENYPEIPEDMNYNEDTNYYDFDKKVYEGE